MTARTERDVLSVIRQRGRIGGRNPVVFLSALTKTNRPDVISALKSLEKGGEVTVDWSHKESGQVNQVTCIKHQRAHIDRTEMSSQSKRENTFAKGIPSHLPDDWCSPVVIIRPDAHPAADPEAPIPTTPTTEGEAMPTHTYDAQAPLHEQLTQCIIVLREMADETGYGDGLSVRATLSLIDGITDSAINRAMPLLYKLGVYRTKLVRYGTSSYWLDLAITEVTPKMLTALKQQKKAKPVASAATVEPEPASHEAAPAAGVTEPVVEDLSEVTKRLAAIITDLEGQNATLRAQLAESEATRRTLSTKLDESEAARRRLSTELDELRPRVTTLDPSVADILQRYTDAG